MHRSRESDKVSESSLFLQRRNIRIKMASSRAIQSLISTYEFLKTPAMVSAPIRVFAGPDLAVATSRAGGLGLIGPSVKSTDLGSRLEKARNLLDQNPVTYNSKTSHGSFSHTIPIGVGFQLFEGDLSVPASSVRKHKSAAACLFMPKTGQSELDDWAARLRQASPSTKIWIEAGSGADAVAAA